MENFNFSGSQITRSDLIQFVFRVSIASAITFYSVKWMISQLDPTSKSKKRAKLRAEEQIKKLCDGKGASLNIHQFNDYELMIASHIVVPEDIPVSWKDIAGLDSVIQELKESVVFPVQHRNLFNHSKLWHAPKGVLLHGPPGCGKTLIAKAIAKECGMRFINLDVAILTDKWYGESQKLASAVFSLAVKIQPCVIFIDEIDSFLRSRNSNDHEATAMMKTLFMMLWDGLSTNLNSTVIVMGATNRPQDLDKAIIRRMPAQFHIGLPNETQRLQVLKLILETEFVATDVDLKRLAKLSSGFSGSDLREMCRNASVYRLRHLMRTNQTMLDGFPRTLSVHDSCKAPTPTEKISAITIDDLMQSFNKMKESKLHTGNFWLENRIELD